MESLLCALAGVLILLLVLIVLVLVFLGMHLLEGIISFKIDCLRQKRNLPVKEK